MTLDPTLYECSDCFDEALMDIGVYDGSLEISLENLDRFNEAYKDEFYNAHVELGWEVRTDGEE